jgi:multisubunit Na+/H+ antiporter MnhB subunit
MCVVSAEQFLFQSSNHRHIAKATMPMVTMTMVTMTMVGHSQPVPKKEMQGNNLQ